MSLHHFQRYQRFVSLAMLLLTTTFCGSVFASTHITGGFGFASGQDIVLTLSVQTSVPANLIIEQYISGGGRVVSTSPSAKKIEGGGARIKWLIRNVQSGFLRLSTRLSAPLTGTVNAVVRYRDPDNGMFTEVWITP